MIWDKEKQGWLDIGTVLNFNRKQAAPCVLKVRRKRKVVSKPLRICRVCNTPYDKGGREICSSACSEVDRCKKKQLSCRTLKQRHKKVRRNLRAEKVSKLDPLWSLSFYTALIKDGLCHYCCGSLPPTGHGLDRVDNDKRHQ